MEESVFAYLERLEKLGTVLGLERIKKALKLLGNPEKKFGSILVTGTNGKGSTAAFIESMLGKAGYKTALFTSPHLISVNERIRVDGKKISNAEFEKTGLRIKNLNVKEKIGLTQFEFLTALGFEFFAEKKVELAVLEIGMGGRLDATNSADALVSVITHVEKEHEKFLGKTLEKIAWEKAGIIKKGAPLVTAERKKSVLKIFKRICRQKKSKLIVVKKPFAGKLALQGDFQRINAATAISAIRELQRKGFRISKKAIREGLASAEWHGRLETIQKKPLVLLDCCHNPDAALALSNSFKKIFPKRKAVLVIGVSKGKDLKLIAESLAKISEKAFVTEAKFRARKASVIKREFEKNRVKARIVFGAKNAAKKAIKTAGKNGIVLITGSCFVVGEAMQLWRKSI